ncbi:hypothetical protein WMF31_32870 [Sorangium sp. So ce1036]|uniref:hypothetical protein n=1 Tax=Sorangium sp. So ce1036 TaxID=3133328 RepID=UPI003F03CACC
MSLKLTSFKRASCVLGCAAALSGCIAGMEDTEALDELTGEAQGALIMENALSANALNLNALNLNALNLNALHPDALSAKSLAALAAPDLGGDMARELVRYAVSCALDSHQSFKFSWRDQNGKLRKERYVGQLGVAPNWATGPLDEYGQRLVSACLAARVNYYQVPVVISVRSHENPLKKLCTSQELIDYPDVEGTFWGNVFAEEPYINACYNSATIDNSRAHKRDCAVGHLGDDGQIVECGMIRIVGPCSDVCEPLDASKQYYQSCIERPDQNSSTTKVVITTSLP